MTTIKKLIVYYSGFFSLPKVAANADKQIDTVYRRRLTKYIAAPEIHKYTCTGCAFGNSIDCPAVTCITFESTQLIFTKIPINAKK